MLGSAESEDPMLTNREIIFERSIPTCVITVPEHRKDAKDERTVWLIDWLSMVLRLRQHNIGYTADGFYRSDDPTNSVKALKEGG